MTDAELLRRAFLDPPEIVGDGSQQIKLLASIVRCYTESSTSSKTAIRPPTTGPDALPTQNVAYVIAQQLPTHPPT